MSGIETGNRNLHSLVRTTIRYDLVYDFNELNEDNFLLIRY